MNIAQQLEEGLPASTLTVVRAVGRLGLALPARCYLVGGSVRDLLLNRPLSQDIDIAVEGDARSLAVAVAQELSGRVSSHTRFGTARVLLPGLALDLATSRRERYAAAGDLPEVEPAGLDEDLGRRDFTINALAAALAPDTWGELHDPYNGRSDLQTTTVRVLHDLSFVDDPTRIVRAVRYCGRLSFNIESHTAALLSASRPGLLEISGARRWKELERILLEDEPLPALALAERLELLPCLFPGLRLMHTVAEKLPEVRASVQDKAARVCVSLCLLAFPLTRQERTRLIAVFQLPRAAAKALVDLDRAALAVASLDAAAASPSQVVAALRDLSWHAVYVHELMSPDGQVRAVLQRYLNEWRQLRPRLKSAELLALGVSPGLPLGACLKALQNARLDGMVTSRSDEQRFVQQWIDAQPPNPALRRIP